MPTQKRDFSCFANDLPWTTARCHRLIRPIVSNINAIRDLEEVEASRISALLQNTAPKQHGLNIDQREKREDARDLDWGTQGPKKRLKRTYANRDHGRRTLKGRNSTDKSTPRCLRISKPGEITIQTPFLTRSFSKTSPKSEGDSTKATSLGKKAIDLSKSQNSTHKSSYYSQKIILYDRLKTAFNKALEATNPLKSYGFEDFEDSLIAAKGPPTLLSLCLRTVPAYIAAEETYRKALDDDDSVDVAAELYAELEDLGTAPGGGWKHLRVVVRAHAVYLIRTAIEEFAFNWVMVGHLQTSCALNNATSETEDLISSYAAGQIRFSSLTPSYQATSLSALRDVLARCQTDALRTAPNLFGNNSPTNGNSGLRQRKRHLSYWEPDTHNTILHMVLSTAVDHLQPWFRHLTNFQMDGRLPLEWLATSVSQKFWRAVIKSICNGDDETFATVRLISVTFTKICGLPLDCDFLEEKCISCSEQQQEALSNTVLSLCTIISSIALLEQQAADSCQVADVSKRIIRPIREVSEKIVREMNRAGRPDIESKRLLTRMIILATDMVLASAGLQLGDAKPEEIFEKRMEQLTILNDQISQLDSSGTSGSGLVSDVIASIAQCYTRAAHESGPELLRYVLERILSFRAQNLAIKESCSTNIPTGRTSIHGSQDILTAQRASLFIKQIALSSAMTFAGHYRTPQAHEIVEMVEQSISASVDFDMVRDSVLRTPAKPAVISTGYRWEQGICEWVSTTPAITKSILTSPLFERRSQPKMEIANDVSPTGTTLIHRAIVKEQPVANWERLVAKAERSVIKANQPPHPKFAVVIPFKEIKPTSVNNDEDHDTNNPDKENIATSPSRSTNPTYTTDQKPITLPKQHPHSRYHTLKKPQSKSSTYIDLDDTSEDELSMHESSFSQPSLGHQECAPSSSRPLSVISAPNATRRKRKRTVLSDLPAARKRITKSLSRRVDSGLCELE